jgi:hypothetical protein
MEAYSSAALPLLVAARSLLEQQPLTYSLVQLARILLKYIINS